MIDWLIANLASNVDRVKKGVRSLFGLVELATVKKCRDHREPMKHWGFTMP